MRTVLALYAGGAGTLDMPSGPIATAIAKRPVAGRVRVEALGLPGDVQVHPTHGGPDRALCLYPHEHYARWDARVSPALGENLTSLGVLETTARIGDVWRIGAALVQVSQPRSPCAKPAARLGVPDLVMRARRERITGLHLRVLEPGELGAGDAIEVDLAALPDHGVSMRLLSDAILLDDTLIPQALAAPQLIPSLRDWLAGRAA